ncbi:MAG: HEAT repeat domain-containing protein, partial [Planctomycetaceae bacterium]|nr:HEAT repeat domain-containing protein [Planctomycetaceae bacterium]
MTSYRKEKNWIKPLATGRWLAFGLASLVASVASGQQVVPLQHRWEIEPGFGDVWNIQREPRAKYLNINDLKSDIANVRFEAAQNICQNYNRPGFRKSPELLKLLVEQLGNPENSVLVKRSIVSAACLLDDGANAQAIWQASYEDPGLAPLVENHLIRWKSPVAAEYWRKVLNDPKSSSSQIERALDGLAQVGQEQDRALCLSLLGAEQSTPITRVTAARALGILQNSGLVGLANDLLKSKDPNKELLASSLLANHTQEDALSVLETVLTQGSSPAQRIAAHAIGKNFPQQGLSRIETWVKHPDDEIRLAALELLKNAPSEPNTRLQSRLLSDPDQVVRTRAKAQLLELCDKGFRPIVDECISQNLSGEAWQGIEQAIILAVELKDRSRCARFLELIEHEQPEVNMHAAWGLMELADDPAIISGIVPHTQKLTAGLESGKKYPKQDIIRLSFLLEVFGRNRYEPVADMLRKYIPKSDFRMGNLSRASAIWALGRILKDQDDPALRASLSERIRDLSSLMPENYLVGYACILTLGEFGFLDSMPTIDRYTLDSKDGLNSAGRWAKEQIQKAAR